MFQGYGANPTPMEFSEVFVALQTGVIDGQENPYANIWAAKFHEVQEYLSETNHVYTPSFPTASKRLFDSWPQEVQDAVLEAGAEVQPWTYETAAKLDEDLKQKLIDGGMAVNEADREAFVAASQPVYEQFAAEVEGGKELIEGAGARRRLLITSGPGSPGPSARIVPTSAGNHELVLHASAIAGPRSCRGGPGWRSPSIASGPWTARNDEQVVVQVFARVGTRSRGRRSARPA
jgi:Bacterial extracellular solute-binding protein, family 7